MANTRELSQLASVISVADETRNIGIGTTNPTSKLHVSGDVRVSGVVTATAFVGDGSALTSISGGSSSQFVTTTAGIHTLSNVGIGTTNPTKPLHIYTADGDIRIGDITDGTGSTDAGIIFTGLGTVTSALFTEVNGEILSYGINCEQIIGIQTARAGGIFRLDTRNEASYADANCFVVKARPIGTSTEYNALVVGLNDGNTYLSPVRGNVLVGTSVSTGTTSQTLQVNSGAYVSGNLGIGTTTPTSKLHVIGDVRVSGVVTATSFSGTDLVGTTLSVSGISTFTNGPILVGTATSTGTASQRLQVTGGAYVSGNLGVGVTNPTQKFQIDGNIYLSGSSNYITNINPSTSLSSTAGAAATVAQFYHSNGNTSYLRVKATRNATGGDWFTASTKLVQVIDVTEMGYVEYNPNGANFGMAFGQGGIEWARFLSGGNLGIGTTTPTSKLHVVGDVRVSGVVTATDFNSTSDISLKDNIQTIANPLDKIIKLNGVTFNWKENQNPSIGVIAQEVEKVFPSLVKTAENKSVNYNGLVGVLIEAVKEQQKQIEELNTSQNGFTSGIGVTNPVKIAVSGNTLTFTVVGVGSTSLRLY